MVPDEATFNDTVAADIRRRAADNPFITAVNEVRDIATRLPDTPERSELLRAVDGVTKWAARTHPEFMVITTWNRQWAKESDAEWLIANLEVIHGDGNNLPVDVDIRWVTDWYATDIDVGSPAYDFTW